MSLPGAADDRRAVALIPLSDATRDISLEPAELARVRLHQMKPVPQTIARGDALPAIGRFLAATHDVELVWLSDGIDLGSGGKFVKDLAQTLGQRFDHNCVRRGPGSARDSPPPTTRPAA